MTQEYDTLVFATGSRPFVPPIPGTTLHGVFVFRRRRQGGRGAVRRRVGGAGRHGGHFRPAVYAVGECAQHRGVVYGLVAPIWEQT